MRFIFISALTILVTALLAQEEPCGKAPGNILPDGMSCEQACEQAANSPLYEWMCCRCNYYEKEHQQKESEQKANNQATEKNSKNKNNDNLTESRDEESARKYRLMLEQRSKNYVNAYVQAEAAMNSGNYRAAQEAYKRAYENSDNPEMMIKSSSAGMAASINEFGIALSKTIAEKNRAWLEENNREKARKRAILNSWVKTTQNVKENFSSSEKKFFERSDINKLDNIGYFNLTTEPHYGEVVYKMSSSFHIVWLGKEKPNLLAEKDDKIIFTQGDKIRSYNTKANKLRNEGRIKLIKNNSLKENQDGDKQVFVKNGKIYIYNLITNNIKRLELTHKIDFNNYRIESFKFVWYDKIAIYIKNLSEPGSLVHVYNLETGEYIHGIKTKAVLTDFDEFMGTFSLMKEGGELMIYNRNSKELFKIPFKLTDYIKSYPMLLGYNKYEKKCYLYNYVHDKLFVEFNMDNFNKDLISLEGDNYLSIGNGREVKNYRLYGTKYLSPDEELQESDCFIETSWDQTKKIRRPMFQQGPTITPFYPGFTKIIRSRTTLTIYYGTNYKPEDVTFSREYHLVIPY